MSFLKKVWRIPVVALVVALPLVAACADDDGASPPGQDPGPATGSISGTVKDVAGAGIIGALVGTSPATTTALTDANGAFTINNVPIPTNPTSYAVTASKEGFQSASATTSLTSTAPNGTVALVLTQQTTPVDTTGNLNVLVTNGSGTPQSNAIVTVANAAGDTVASDTTDATGFALFVDLNRGSYTVSATKTISGIAFRASGGVNVSGGETAFLQLILSRDFGQTVFPNIGGVDVTLDDSADIFFVPVPGSEDDDPTVDCNIIRTQHMFIAEVNDGSGAAVSGVKVQWDLNISAGGFLPPNTGSVVDSDDPDLNPATARGGLTPAFNVDTRKAITFTNDNDQTVTFNGQSVTIGAGQTWIIITSPVEGITDVIAATPDIPASDPDCANSSPDACDKEFAIKRWVNWDTSVAELELTPGFVGDPNADVGATFNFLSEGQTVTNVLSRVDTLCAVGVPPDDLGTGAIECELFDDRVLFYAEVARLRQDSPFTLTAGTIEFEVTDDTPDVELIGDQGAVDCPATDGVQNVECVGPTEDEFVVFTPSLNLAEGEFDAGNAGTDLDEIGWVVFELRLDEGEFFCVDVDASGTCDPGNVGSPDTFSTATQRLLAGQTDNTNTFAVRFLDEFGEICDDFIFNKRWVASRLQVIKSTPDATVRTVTEANGGPDSEPTDVARPLKTHTIQIGQEFAYTITAINDGDTRSDNVRITDTLPRFGVQFDNIPPDDGAPTFRNGSQAFAYVTDRPAFDPVAVVYAIDDANDEAGDIIDECVRGDDGTVVGNAYVVPAPCALVLTTDAGTIASARAEAEDRSAAGDQIVWIQFFDDQILARTDVGGGIQSEDTVEITLVADEDLVGPYPPLPGTWCNISTVTDGPGNLTGVSTQSLDADTLCHEVREALLDIRKTAEDAVISAGAQAVWTVAIANNGSATLTNVVINDTLDLVFATSDSLFAEDDVVVDTVAFPGATVVVNPDGRTFTVTIGDLPPTSGFVDVFTVRAITPSTEGVFCNRVTVRGTNPAGTLVETDISCVTTTVTIELDISNEDGSVDAGGVFTSTQEVFLVGDDIFYQVIITNQSANFTATGVLVVDEVAPTTAAIEFREVRTGFPTQGTVSGTSDAGFTWNIGSLAPGAAAEIQFRAEGVAPQSTVGNRVRLTADQLTGEIVDEEPTTVTQ